MGPQVHGAMGLWVYGYVGPNFSSAEYGATKVAPYDY